MLVSTYAVGEGDDQPKMDAATEHVEVVNKNRDEGVRCGRFCTSYVGRGATRVDLRE